MAVTGTRRRRHNQRQQHQECREPEHRPEHPFRGFFDHWALTPEAIEIIGSLLKNGRELHEFDALGSEKAPPRFRGGSVASPGNGGRVGTVRASGGHDLNQFGRGGT